MYNNFYQMPSMGNDNFVGVYVSSYDEVVNTPAPINGSAMIFADLNNMMLYSKKNTSGVPVIQPYKLTPIYQEAQKPQVEKSVNNDTNLYKSIMDELQNLRTEINNMKGNDINGSNDINVNGTTKKQ